MKNTNSYPHAYKFYFNNFVTSGFPQTIRSLLKNLISNSSSFLDFNFVFPKESETLSNCLQMINLSFKIAVTIVFSYSTVLITHSRRISFKEIFSKIYKAEDTTVESSVVAANYFQFY